MIKLCCEYLSVQCIWLYVLYSFQNVSTICSCLNVKELLAWNRCNIWSLSDCNMTGMYNYLVCKLTLNHLAKQAKLLSCVVRTYLYVKFDFVFLLCHICVSEWIHTLYLPECQGTPCSKQAQHLKFTCLQRDSNLQALTSQTNTQPFSQTGQMIELCCDYLSVRAFNCMLLSWLYVLIMVECSFWN